jgi:hypothetical protein
MPTPHSHWCPHTQKLFCPPVLKFYRKKPIKNRKRNMTFLLVLDKDSYTRRFLVLFPYVYELQPQLVYLF